MYRIIKANEEIPEDALVIEIEFIYTEEVTYTEEITADKRIKKDKNIFPDHKIIIKNVKAELIKYGFKVFHINHSNSPGSPSTYYDTEIIAKDTKSKKVIFVRVSNHEVTDNQAQINKLERPKKAKAHLNEGLDKSNQINDAQKYVHWDELDIRVEGKSYKTWDKAFNYIKTRIKEYAEMYIKND